MRQVGLKEPSLEDMQHLYILSDFRIQTLKFLVNDRLFLSLFSSCEKDYFPTISTKKLLIMTALMTTISHLSGKTEVKGEAVPFHHSS